MKPPDHMITMALLMAKSSPCRSKRGVVCYVESSAIAAVHPEWRVSPTPGYNAGPVIIGRGYNGPPESLTCPGREVCAGTCGRRSVHAEMRALRNRPPEGMKVELVHVELAADGGVVACDGPRCEQCSREILDVGFVAGVWLYQTPESLRSLFIGDVASGAVRYELRGQEIADQERRVVRREMMPCWVRFDTEAFHRATLRRCGLVP